MNRHDTLRFRLRQALWFAPSGRSAPHLRDGCMNPKYFRFGRCFVLGLVSMSGCASSPDIPSDEILYQREAASRSHGMIQQDVMQLIHGIRPRPGPEPAPDYTEADWRRLLSVAAVCQKVDPPTLDGALHDYIVHYATSFEDDVDSVAEWTKPLLLLRVMFELPEKEGGPYPGAFTFGAFAYIGCESEPTVPDAMALPIFWGPQGPRFAARFFGYYGADYAADKEYKYFLMHCPLRRNLTNYLTTCPSTQAQPQ